MHGFLGNDSDGDTSLLDRFFLGGGWSSLAGLVGGNGGMGAGIKGQDVIWGCSGIVMDSKTNQAKLLTARCKSEAMVFQSAEAMLLIAIAAQH